MDKIPKENFHTRRKMPRRAITLALSASVLGCFCAVGILISFSMRKGNQGQQQENRNATYMSEVQKQNKMTQMSKTGKNTAGTETAGTDEANAEDFNTENSKDEDSREVQNNQMTNMLEIKYPESEFFRQTASNIWGKDYHSITAEEYASLTSLQIDTAEKTVSYQLDHGFVQTMSYGTETEMDTADLAAFPGLEWLSLDRPLQPGDLQGLGKLFAVYARNTVNELADIIPHPETVTELGIADDTGEKSLEGIRDFPSLEHLAVNYRYLEDISALRQVPALKGLMLEKSDSLGDYSPLTALADLEWLKIESGKLESLDFIGSMEKLISLSVEGSRIRDLELLKGHAGLTFLALRNNPEIDDYSVIGELEGLEELTLEMGHGGILPSFRKLERLERLSLKDVEDLSPLEDAGSVISLFLDHCSGAQLEAISAMKELDTLEIHGFSTAADSLDPLTEMPKLTSFNLQNVVIDSDIRRVFDISSLKSLHLDHCRVGLDFSTVQVNENLEILSMNGISFINRSADGEAQEEKLQGHYEFFDCFPNLTELYLESLGLEDIAFVEKLPRLQHLDIRDNPVTSLRELQKLEEIETVWYGGGTIVFP